ncbi:MAG: hypothetical protein M0D53_05005 [Flavobacterium sp. JAD_PAG50586_2]|nr:MAG: hypothetical protein M0D53_05005 [Flavobacterium sp. JAD_PAG50586_2]
MKRILSSTLALIVFSLSIGCSSSNNDTPPLSCGRQAEIINQTTFDQVNITNYMITNVALNVDCLDITISSSGCNANNWDMNLFSTSAFSSTSIAQKQLKIELINEEACLAVFQKTVSFSLIPYRIDGHNEINLIIQGWSTPINYTY